MRSPILNTLLSQTAPQTLYHYTNQRGFLGIIRSKQIWLTHTQYLNDRREFTHAVDLAKDEVEHRLPNAPASTKEILLAMQDALRANLATTNVCVCSFSQTSDSLSQWRAYGTPSGFAIGFAANFLREIANNEFFYLAPCIYDERRQREIVQAIIDEALEDVLNPDTDSVSVFELGDHRRTGGSLVP
jgi:hypothetical protein